MLPPLANNLLFCSKITAKQLIEITCTALNGAKTRPTELSFGDSESQRPDLSDGGNESFQGVLGKKAKLTKIYQNKKTEAGGPGGGSPPEGSSIPPFPICKIFCLFFPAVRTLRWSNKLKSRDGPKRGLNLSYRTLVR